VRAGRSWAGIIASLLLVAAVVGVMCLAFSQARAPRVVRDGEPIKSATTKIKSNNEKSSRVFRLTQHAILVGYQRHFQLFFKDHTKITALNPRILPHP
jgi:hypothetical protein